MQIENDWQLLTHSRSLPNEENPAAAHAPTQFVKHLAGSGWDLDAVDYQGTTPRARLRGAEDDGVRAAVAAAGLI